jgi:hypothetical protein
LYSCIVLNGFNLEENTSITWVPVSRVFGMKKHRPVRPVYKPDLQEPGTAGIESASRVSVVHTNEWYVNQVRKDWVIHSRFVVVKEAMSTYRARGMREQPRINAMDMEGMEAFGHESEDVAIRELTQAYTTIQGGIHGLRRRQR